MTHEIPEGWTSMTDMFVYANSVTGQVFGIAFLMGIWFVMFLALKMYHTEKAMTVASIMTAVVSVLFVGAKVVPEIVLPVAFALAIISLFMEAD